MVRYLLFFIFMASQQVRATGIEFFQGTWEQALEKASKEEKLIFVDAYAEWCGPCKRMAANVFTQTEVGDFYNANFINLKIDMEKPENETFRKQYPVAAFPTLYYIDFTGEVVQKVKGAQTVDGFIQIGKTALNKNNRLDYFTKLYEEEGKRDAATVLQYIKALNRADKSSIKIANDYLKTQTELSTPQNLNIIFEATTVVDSRIFDLLINYRAAIEAITSKEAVNLRIREAAHGTLDKAIAFESEDLLKEAQEKMKTHVPKLAEAFLWESEMTYAKLLEDSNRYLKAWNNYVKKVSGNEPQEWTVLATTLASAFPDDEKALEQASKLAKKAVSNSKDYETRLGYALILNMQNNKLEAQKMAEAALKIATQQKNDQAIQRISYFLQQL